MSGGGQSGEAGSGQGCQTDRSGQKPSTLRSLPSTLASVKVYNNNTCRRSRGPRAGS